MKLLGELSHNEWFWYGSFGGLQLFTVPMWFPVPWLWVEASSRLLLSLVEHQGSIKFIMRSWVSRWSMMKLEWTNGWSIVDALKPLPRGLQNFILESSWACQTSLPNASIEPASAVQSIFETLTKSCIPSRLLLKQLARIMLIDEIWWDPIFIHLGEQKAINPPATHTKKVLDTEPCFSTIWGSKFSFLINSTAEKNASCIDPCPGEIWHLQQRQEYDKSAWISQENERT